MTRLVVDASALAALIFQEPGADDVRQRLDGAQVFAPTLLRYELANVAWKKIQRQPRDSARIVAALAATLEVPAGLVWRDVDHADVVLIAEALRITAYDAAYVWLAAVLGADLVTLDRKLARATAGLAA